MKDDERLVRIGGVCGIIAFLIYGSAILLNNLLPGHSAKTIEEFLTALGTGKNGTIMMGAYFFIAAFGLLGIISMLGLHRALTHKRTSILATLGMIYAHAKSYHSGTGHDNDNSYCARCVSPLQYDPEVNRTTSNSSPVSKPAFNRFRT